MVKTGSWGCADAETRKPGERTGLDTPVVLAVNDGHWVGGSPMGSLSQGNREVPRLGSMVARLKLKGIDGGSHKRWSMWLNSRLRAKPYPGLDISQEPGSSSLETASERYPVRELVQVLHGCRQLVS